jgi:hypothetical protein
VADGNILQAGESVPFSGAYEVVYSGQHREAHYVLALRGEAFPGCLRCSDQVKFQLGLSAVHVVTHPIFHSEQRVKIGEEYSS